MTIASKQHDEKPPLQLCSLPYDIRQLIYDEIFPPYNQLYLQASRKDLLWVRPMEDIPTALLLVNHQLHSEAGEYLYNRYLFNIIGSIQDCLRVYPGFEQVMQKYARQPIRIDAFGNGEHSDTCCISLQPGTKHLKVLNRRRRGKPSTVDVLRSSMRKQDKADGLVVFCDRARSVVRRAYSRVIDTRLWLTSIAAVLIAAAVLYIHGGS